MRSIMTTYALLWRILSGPGTGGAENESFDSICRRLRVPPCDLEEILQEELGLCGEETVRIFDRNRPDSGG